MEYALHGRYYNSIVKRKKIKGDIKANEKRKREKSQLREGMHVVVCREQCGNELCVVGGAADRMCGAICRPSKTKHPAAASSAGGRRTNLRRHPPTPSPRFASPFYLGPAHCI